MVEVWILLVSVFVTNPNNVIEEQKYRAEFPTADACQEEGQKRIADAVPDPATWYCFKKGEEL